jgi:hypothetical protein
MSSVIGEVTSAECSRRLIKGRHMMLFWRVLEAPSVKLHARRSAT